jgi:hypothetical protein
MGTANPSDADTLLRIVRGELPLAALTTIGITLRIEQDRCRVENPNRVHVRATVPDLARGVLAHRHDPATLRDWALFIQAADIEVDAPRHPADRILLEALWSAASLTPISPETLAALEQVVCEGTSS